MLVFNHYPTRGCRQCRCNVKGFILSQRLFFAEAFDIIFLMSCAHFIFYLDQQFKNRTLRRASRRWYLT